MKNIILIPGYSAFNKDIFEEYYQYFHKKECSTRFLKWSHWDGNEVFHFEHEQKKIISTLQKINGNVIVIAKSIGTLLFLSILPEINIENIDHCYLLGMPLGSEDFEKMVKAIKSVGAEKITIIHADKDPTAPYGQIKRLVDIYFLQTKLKFITLHRNDHTYPLEAIVEFFPKF
jgi:predicted alpha/beta hydrolase family esterase